MCNVVWICVDHNSFRCAVAFSLDPLLGSRVSLSEICYPLHNKDNIILSFQQKHYVNILYRNVFTYI